MGKFCKNCGSPMKENEKFCAKCGTKTDSVRTVSSGGVKRLGTPIAGGNVNRVPSMMRGNANRVPLMAGGIGVNENGYKIVLVIISVLMIVATLVPYLETMGQTISLLFTDGDQVGDGAVYIGLAVICIVGAGIGKKIVTVITGVIASLGCCYELYQLNSAYREFSIFSGLVIKRAGFYMIIITSFSMLVVSILYFLQTGGMKKN